MSDTIVVIESVPETITTVETGAVVGMVPSPVVLETDANADEAIYHDDTETETVSTETEKVVATRTPEPSVISEIGIGPQGAPGEKGDQGERGETGIGVVPGTNEGDLLRWNAATGNWESFVADGLHSIANPNDGEVHLTPKLASTGAEGTMFYNSLDDHVYVGVEP